ncbi:MAG: GNAT family N-acetyltransferase [Microthrixaceae bacterium]
MRRASSGDYQDMAALRWRWRSGEGGETNPDNRTWTEEFVTWLHDHEPSHLGVVALAGEDLVGEGWLALVDRVPTVSATPPGHLGLRRSGYVQALYVTPEHRGTGIGAQMLDLLVSEARDAQLSYVSVHPSQRSFPLYRRAGFTDTDRVLQLRF